MFVKLEKYDGGFSRFGDGQTAQIVGISSITFDGKHNTDSVYYVNGLHHNLLDVGQMCGNGFNVVFQDGSYEIQKRSKTVIATGKKTGGNMYPLEATIGHCLLS